MTSDRARGDELIERIIAEGDDGQTSNDLLGEFFSGYPIEKLIPLLRSDDEETAKVGAFIAEELGAKAAPLMPDIARLLGHPNRKVRSDILDAVLVAATTSDGAVIARAVTLINDPEYTVRFKSLEFLARAKREKLIAGLPCITDSEIAGGLEWLLNVEDSPEDDSEIESRIDDEDRLMRWFGAVAAARSYRRNPSHLNHAAESSDEEMRAFAASQQRRFQRERPRRK